MSLLTEGDVLKALKDGHARVQTQAVRISESITTGTGAIGGMVSQLAQSNDDPLAFQSILTLGRWAVGNLPKTFAKAARKHAHDEHFRNAILSSAPWHLPVIFEDLREN